MSCLETQRLTKKESEEAGMATVGKTGRCKRNPNNLELRVQ